MLRSQNTPHFSKHAEARFRQRGLTSEAVALVMEFGESVDDGFVMTKKVLGTARRELKAQQRAKEGQQLDHLYNIVVINLNDVILTAYRADKKRLRRLRIGHVLTDQKPHEDMRTCP